MKPKIRPIKDLYFRFIEGTEFVGVLNAQDVAVALSRGGLVELIAHKSEPVISHYRDIMAPNHAETEIYDIIEAYHKGTEGYDSTPYCHACGAKHAKQCHCGPIAENN